MTSLHKHRPITLTAAAILSSLLIASLAHAGDSTSVTDASAVALRSAEEQNAALLGGTPFASDTEGLLSTPPGATIDGTELLLGPDYPNIGLPAADEVRGEPTADGTVVFNDAAPGLDIVVEGATDGLARLLTVADEDYSATGAQFPVVSDPIPLVVIGLAAIARAHLPALFRQGAKALATQTIRAGVKTMTKGGCRTFSAFKKDTAGSTPKGNQWHHIFEQSNISKRGWDAGWVHNRNNLVSIPNEVHQKCVNSWMGKKNVSKFGIKSGNSTMRQTIQTLSFSKQHEIGAALLKHCGVTF